MAPPRTDASSNGLTPVETILHASCVAYAERAVLISGASGSGKSALALQLMAFGAALVSDDRTIVRAHGERLLARAPDTIRGKIEARGVGILKAASVEVAQVVLAVDLDRVETNRLPHPDEIVMLGQSVPLLCKVEAPHFAAALMQILRQERHA
ncbi:HPr kinase/phosphatase C-terminal domain-containing protein [Shimia sp.]|uniref:HPr kinase/phosphorylase n=1 Tax=Shimia sp. TaxID=1954381 RepID=UPI0032972C45